MIKKKTWRVAFEKKLPDDSLAAQIFFTSSNTFLEICLVLWGSSMSAVSPKISCGNSVKIN